MFKCIRDHTPCLPQWWINITLNHSFFIVILALLVSAGISAYTITNFKINANLTEMISNKLAFRKIYKDYKKAFPERTDTLVVVVEADTPELALHNRRILANRLMKEKDVFKTIYLPGGGNFFEKNGLLYLSVDKLEELTDNLADVQPFLSLLSQDMSLNAFFSILEEFINKSAGIIPENGRILLLFDRLGDALESTMNGRPYQVSWQEIMTGQTIKKSQLRQFIVIQPFLNYSRLSPGKTAINIIHRIIDELELNTENGVSVRITGNIALKNDDLESVKSSIGTASLISFILVGILLYVGLQSIGLVVVSLLTLVIGLIWTMGFAIAFIGRLNMISISFVVLFIGLGVDYSIQFCLRYEELMETGSEKRTAIGHAARDMGNALFLCSITTAIGFYAFVPTSYSGASELGLISGTGMFLIFFANLTVLPSLLNLIPYKKGTNLSLSAGKMFSFFSNQYPGTIIIGTIILGVGAATLLHRVSFDFNPLNLSNPAAESVITAKELFENGKTSPWYISVLTDTLKDAKALAFKLEKLPEVESAVTVADLVPENQAEKLGIISDIALFMPEIPKKIHIKPLDETQTFTALKRFGKTLKDSLLSDSVSDSADTSRIRRLYNAVERFSALRSKPKKGLPQLILLEKGLLLNLSIALDNLYTMLNGADAFGLSDLPKKLTERFVSNDGRYLIQVLPQENISDINALKRFVSTVRIIAPGATGTPVAILESGRAIISAFISALLIALSVIIIFLLWVLRNWLEILLTITPLMLAMLFTAATSVLLDIPFNFANIIILPLLLGIGVDYGIHLMYRFRTEPSSNKGVLQTSTARAVLFSALTTIVSFSSLSLSSHRGVASMGILLAICNIFMIICTLMILPAILKRYEGVMRRNSDSFSA